ncbi:hypothetical protein LC048_11850 [Mesobacillus subterraneus]|uniref:hypothetical protein n=1 Tax=Mesobacillus subterraneus TaxID=285983 RepID=UPI001CFE35F7|nr:hypothetical protein [Mesobacillus subterraneus]WLR57480.1 hypothetical protein LC048_11850 [Mesobacillus subterraneus]
MYTRQNAKQSLPVPSRWGIDAVIAGKPIVRGTITINSISGNFFTGTANFRGDPIPIQGSWDENSQTIRFDSPYASFAGQLTIYDDPGIKVRHLVLSGKFLMNPPSLQAGESGSWIATTDKVLTGPPINTTAIPPVGVFLTSDLLYNTGRRYSGRYER